jgi:polyisoprenoid-binding protein YceI
MTRRSIVLTLSLALPGLPALAVERALSLDPAATGIHFHLGATGHDVEGAFELVTGQIRFDPATGAASGEIRVDATGAKTGNAKRDKKMHQEVLDSATYPQFVFKPSHVDGRLSDSGTSELRLVGSMSVHGVEHPLTVPATVTVDGDHISAETTFAIPFVEWGMKDPSWLVLRVDKEVQVTVTSQGHLGSAMPVTP